MGLSAPMERLRLLHFFYPALPTRYCDLYAKRKETIERAFAGAKEKHAMRYTQYHGLVQVSKWVRLKFAAMNLKIFF